MPCDEVSTTLVNRLSVTGELTASWIFEMLAEHVKAGSYHSPLRSPLNWRMNIVDLGKNQLCQTFIEYVKKSTTKRIFKQFFFITNAWIASCTSSQPHFALIQICTLLEISLPNSWGSQLKYFSRGLQAVPIYSEHLLCAFAHSAAQFLPNRLSWGQVRCLWRWGHLIHHSFWSTSLHEGWWCVKVIVLLKTSHDPVKHRPDKTRCRCRISVVAMLVQCALTSSVIKAHLTPSHLHLHPSQWETHR